MTDEELTHFWQNAAAANQQPLVTVTGGDYVYTGRLVSVFVKWQEPEIEARAPLRCAVQDSTRRLFIHNASQITAA